MKYVYVCDYCGRDDFKTADECKKHEKAHRLEEKMKKVPGAVICPSCNGEGGYYGNDGCNWRECNLCGGEGVVIPHSEVVEKVTYERI